MDKPPGLSDSEDSRGSSVKDIPAETEPVCVDLKITRDEIQPTSILPEP